MEKIFVDEKDKASWQSPEWYHALSLAERLAPRQAETEDIPARDGKDVKRAASRLKDWKAQAAFEDGTLFPQRLAQDTLSEQDLLALLAEPMAGLRLRISTPPDWFTALTDTFSDTGAAEMILPLLQKVDVDHSLAACLPALSPLLERGLTYLHDQVQALQQQYARVPFEVDLVPLFFLKNIVNELLFQVSKPVILQMHIARLKGQLRGEMPEDRFAEFVRQLNHEGKLLPLLAQYPVLARQLIQAVDQAAHYMGEFLGHLCADWQALASTFMPEGDPGLLVDVQAGMGDKHRRGRSVLLLKFGSGLQLLYKPKSLAVDVHMQELLNWLNEHGATPPFRTLIVIDRGDYGWSEFVMASSCHSTEEVARFYERQGSYLALLYALNAGDVHNENVIAAGEHPVLVDLEVLFHPHLVDQDSHSRGDLALHAINESVWQVGLLPRLIWSNIDSLGVDISGLGGRPGQVTPRPVSRWQAAGTDQMVLVRKHIEIPVSQNNPRLGDQDVDVLDYQDSIITGFSKMYLLLCEQRQALLTEQLPRFAHDEVRVLMRSTWIYSTLLSESYHPDLLRDALDRDRFFDHLWGEVKQHPFFTLIISSEQQDLRRGDIPIFTTFPDSRTIYNSDKKPLVDFLDVPSLELVRQQIQKLDERDLAKQVWIIRASLATLMMGREDAIPVLPFEPVLHPVRREQLLDLANAVGKRLEELALQNDTGAYWLGVSYVDEHVWSIFPTGTDLYNGTSGLALFLGYLGALTGEMAYTRLAQRSLASLRSVIQEQDAYSIRQGVGAFVGWGSMIYLLSHLGVLWNDPSLFREGEELADKLLNAISEDKQRDIIGGAAGGILSVLSLYAVDPSPRILETAVRCGEHLLATAQRMPQGIAWETLKGEPPLGGFSHGTAGIAYSLFRLAATSGQERFRQTALGALEYDRSLFIPRFKNWADLRVLEERSAKPKPADEPPAEAVPKAMVAWCHGAPGIGLGRLGALQELDDARIREEIDIAVDTTVRSGFAGNHSLCHGALGNLELILTAAQILGRSQDRDALAQATAAVVGSIETNGWVSAVPLGVETPGLMTGLAGIGYELLRLAEPAQVPSILLVAPPGSPQRSDEDEKEARIV